MDQLTRQVLCRSSVTRKVIFVSDGVLKGAQVRRMAADFRAQETIRRATERVLSESGCRIV